jgi:hypothetical protein
VKLVLLSRNNWTHPNGTAISEGTKRLERGRFIWPTTAPRAAVAGQAGNAAVHRPSNSIAAGRNVGEKYRQGSPAGNRPTGNP